ncbi:MAG TPA: PIN domain-containing protein [Microlunatus sp.]
MTVLDASALLAFLQGETGAELVEQLLIDGAVCGAANWSEVAQKVQRRSGDWSLARALLLSYDLTVEPVTAVDGERAAQRWVDRPQLSLGDRLCLALAERLESAAVTADSAWGSSELIRQIR